MPTSIPPCTVEVPGPIDVDSLPNVPCRRSRKGESEAKGIGVQDAADRWHEVHLAAGRVEVTERLAGSCRRPTAPGWY